MGPMQHATFQWTHLSNKYRIATRICHCAPIFNLFIKDIFDGINSNKVKFADDSTIWRTGSDLDAMISGLNEDILKVFKWCSQWRLKLNVEKTEVCCFSKDKQAPNAVRNKTIHIDNSIIPYNTNPKMLGIHLDEQMTFDRHIK